MRQIRLAILFAVLSIQYSTPLKSQPQEMNKICHSQIYVSLNQLNNTIWKVSMGNANYPIINKYAFTEKNVTDVNEFNYCDAKGNKKYKKYENTWLYYLSNIIPSSFDKTKAGKINKGKYIVIQSKTGFTCYQFMYISDKELHIKPAYRNKSDVIGIPETIRYVRVN